MKPIKNNKFSDDELSSSSSSSDFGSDDEPINVNNNNNKINNKKGGKNSNYNEPMEEDEDDEELDIGDENSTSNNNNNSGGKNKNKNEDEDEEFNEDEDEEFNEEEEDLEDEEDDEEDEEIEGNNKNNNNNLIGTSRQKDMKRGSGGGLNQKLLAPIPQEVKKIKVLTDEMKQKKSEIALYRRNKKIEEDEASMRDVVNQLFYRKAATKETSAEDEKKPSRHDLFLKQINGKTVCYKDDSDNGKTLSYPIGHPMIEQIEKDKEISKNTATATATTTTTTTVKINTPIKCSVLNCNNIKRYNCPKNNLPVCTYECWQKVMNTPVTTTTATNLQ
ncbi:hypothetical protein DDB_G0273549 [Dictyostelium discoideum AX4]|uniref:INO80 complex subunit B-like conserved region domain-containing protein n=1 Tax=Dictyostelium discoideum TaxID=44689 RepID=Q557H9_DICDI|nr:hypothetical protein DDB_G0273415 [Dictyostelium discoideum AX4]XP_644656.1 hypothetical protein DDB_G0273549 [Dictyostelium discoideum AX4]EAL70662.1 hypothetical protein DDB_G0273415 [Dictyostelium discoideum AX4]EAL70729.1 hypothetical protein DDB_G0273549 [Dictyostelium discoideum AX4]|eukprot:XP_644595.1 hypothetical protein DDB_G0273415 [Dictyostelium discoideum AX4]